MNPILSILTPAIWFRSHLAERLMNKITEYAPVGAVEHLVLFDDRTRSIGLKRQALVDIARGQYIAFVDDDDDILTPAYLDLLLAEAAHSPDIITFDQRAIIDGVEGRIHFDAACQEDPPWQPGQTVTRAPWHVCAWRRDIVASCLFPDTSYGEDLQWCLQARPRLRTARHIPQVLHTYRHDARFTAAPPPK